MGKLEKEILEVMDEMWGQTFCKRSLLYESIFFEFRRRGISFGWIPRTKHVFIGYERSLEKQQEFLMTSTHDDCGWAVAELVSLSGDGFYWTGFKDTQH